MPNAAQGFTQLLNSPAAVAAAGSEAAATAAAARVPLLVRRTPRPAASSAAAALQSQQQQSRGLASLLPSAAAAAAPCWRSPYIAAAALGRRGYAQLGTRAPKSSYAPPPEMQRAMQMRLSMVSSNLLAEPYRGVPPRLPLTAYFTLSGWRELGRRFMGQFKSLYTLAKCK